MSYRWVLQDLVWPRGIFETTHVIIGCDICDFKKPTDDVCKGQILDSDSLQRYLGMGCHSRLSLQNKKRQKVV